MGIRLGLWEDSISSNIAAVAAARKHGDQGEEFHALDYLAYAYLQLGRNGEAEKIRDDLPALANVKPSSLFKINYTRAAIRARCTLEQQHWTEAENLVADPGGYSPRWMRFRTGRLRCGPRTRETCEQCGSIQNQCAGFQKN